MRDHDNSVPQMAQLSMMSTNSFAIIPQTRGLVATDEQNMFHIPSGQMHPSGYGPKSAVYSDKQVPPL